MDLEDKELKATRKLNGVAKDSNIEIIENFINEIKDFELNKDVVEIVNALKDILEEREADKKKIKELEEENRIFALEGSRVALKLHIEENYIPKQKVIDLMVKAMNKIQDPQVCKYCDNNINLNNGYCTDAKKCKEGIKQYFERKVKK